MSECGVLVGCDAFQGWILPWWWKHYHRHNDLPVTFADFGMTDQMRAWCQKRGGVICPDVWIPEKKRQLFDKKTRKSWEILYGTEVWTVRHAWMKKACAFMSSPYPKTLWLDNDCKVLGNIEEIFAYLEGHDLALCYDAMHDKVKTSQLKKIHPLYQLDPVLFQKGLKVYNSGVVAYDRKSSFLHQYKEALDAVHAFLPGDQDILSYAIAKYQPKIRVLPQYFNHSHELPLDKMTKICYYHGGSGKLKILQNDLKHLLDTNPEDQFIETGKDG